VLVLTGNTLFRLGYKVGWPVAFGALAVIPSVITLLIWGARKRGTQPPQ
jgi:hypothetical protein